MRLKSVEGAGEKQPPTSNGKQVAELMKVLAENTSLSKIKDSVAWQREIRQDRKLPFRD